LVWFVCDMVDVGIWMQNQHHAWIICFMENVEIVMFLLIFF